MIENKGVPVEKKAAGGRESARDYDPSLSLSGRCLSPAKPFPQSTVAVDNFVGKPGVRAGRGRQIKALDNLPQV
jgi:hypothetical protein